MKKTEQKTSLSTTEDKFVPDQRTKTENNHLALKSLTGLAILCVVLSGAILFCGGPGAQELAKNSFAPVGIIVAGLLGFIKS